MRAAANVRACARAHKTETEPLRARPTASPLRGNTEQLRAAPSLLPGMAISACVKMLLKVKKCAGVSEKMTIFAASNLIPKSRKGAKSMRFYYEQDDEGWRTEFRFDSIEECEAFCARYFTYEEWKNSTKFYIFEVDTLLVTQRLIKTLYRCTGQKTPYLSVSVKD